jgi:hypothetical protein
MCGTELEGKPELLRRRKGSDLSVPGLCGPRDGSDRQEGGSKVFLLAIHVNGAKYAFSLVFFLIASARTPFSSIVSPTLLMY